MATVDELRKGRATPHSIYLHFVLHTEKGKDGLFLFFEGKDSQYYLQRITPYFTGNYHQILCNGKETVLSVYDLISTHREYDKYKKAFFIDRDFNSPISADKRIYETPCYSIENLYVSPEVFGNIIKGEFKISEIDDAFDELVKLYSARQSEFHDCVSLLNAWYACLVRIREETGRKMGVQLDEKLPSGFVRFSLDAIECDYDFAEIMRQNESALEVGKDRLNNMLHTFSLSDRAKTFRGKYEMQFLLEMLKVLIDDSRTGKKYITEKIKFSFSSGLTNDQALNIFSAYAETPESLIEYIKRVVQ